MRDITYPDFDVVKENWWKWELDDGLIVKAMLSAISFQIKSEENSEHSLIGFNFKSIVGLERINPKSKSQVPVVKSKIWKSQSEKSVKLKLIENVKLLSVERNYYEIHPEPDVTLLVIVSLTEPKIQLTNKFISSGDPVYLVSTQHSISLISISAGEELTSQLEEIDEGTFDED